jgi:hypothetical protein
MTMTSLELFGQSQRREKICSSKPLCTKATIPGTHGIKFEWQSSKQESKSRRLSNKRTLVLEKFGI